MQRQKRSESYAKAVAVVVAQRGSKTGPPASSQATRPFFIPGVRAAGKQKNQRDLLLIIYRKGGGSEEVSIAWML